MDTYQKAEKERREKILAFWKSYGLAATRDAFAVSRATLFRWQQDAVPKSRAHTGGYQERVLDLRLKAEILRIRGIPETCRLGKGKLLPLLEEFCEQAGVPEVLSESRVGRILTDLKNKGELPDPKKLRVDARTGKLHEKKNLRKPKLRRNGYLPKNPGDLLQIDGVVKFVDGIRRYTFTAIDLVSRWSFSRTYTSDTSRNGTDFLKRCLTVAPFPVTHIQTDNGGEFLALFQNAALELGITHFFNWPRKPRYQAWVESFNGTIQVEFLDWHRSALAGPTEDFNLLLEEWTSWYNERRPHSSLKHPRTGRQQSPLAYLNTYEQSQRG